MRNFESRIWHSSHLSVLAGGLQMRHWLVGFLTLALSIAAAPAAFAQNAQISGTVKDQSGAVIPGATVTARNVDTGLSRVAVSDGTGEYRLVSLPPGHYS